jgi:outer membrane lipopolysaccharide assembly protein LptE/RlpB
MIELRDDEIRTIMERLQAVQIAKIASNKAKKIGGADGRAGASSPRWK